MTQARRRFLNVVLGGGVAGWLASSLYPIFSFLKPPEIPEANVNSVKWGPVDAFPPNSSQIVRFGRKPVILVRTATGDFKALEGTCTHLDCTVQYRSDEKDIWCACHNGVYDLTGRNVSGPPPRPLTEYEVNIVDNEIFVVAPKV